MHSMSRTPYEAMRFTSKLMKATIWFLSCNNQIIVGRNGWFHKDPQERCENGEISLHL